MSTHVYRSAAGLLLPLVLAGAARAQFDVEPHATGRKVQQNHAQSLQQQANEIIGLSGSTMVELDLDTTPGVIHTLNVAIEGVLETITLAPHSVRHPGLYRVVAQVEGGAFVEQTPGPVRTFRGFVAGHPGSVVIGGLHDDGAHLMIELDQGGARHWVEPVGAHIAGVDPALHVVYRNDQVHSHGSCGLATEIDDAPDPMNDGGGVAGQMSDCFWFTELAVDADFPFFEDWNSVTGVENRVNLITNISNFQYESQVTIHHDLTTILVRTSLADDPYPDLDPGETIGASTLLNLFESEWSSGSEAAIPRDLAQLYTGRDLTPPTIGIARLAQVCDTFDAFLVVENAGSLGCATDLTAHEMGHVWSAGHCAGGCGTTMNSSLTCANVFGQGAINQISAYRNAVQNSCLVNDCIPSNNTCEGAITVGDGSFMFSTDNTLTSGPLESICSFDGDSQVGSDVWYRYEAECTDDITVGVCSSNYDTKLAIYSSFCPEFSESAIACSDDDCSGDKSIITFPAQAGLNYYIRIGGFQEEQGSGILTIESPICLPPPGNDACGSAPFISTYGMHPFDTAGATTDGPEEGCTEIQRDIWYRFAQGTCDNQTTISICDASFDCSLAVYGSSCPSGPGELLECSDDSCGTGPSITFTAAPATFYRIRIGSPTGLVGIGNMLIECNEPPDCNDNGTPDVDDISGGTSQDCNTNGIPDECDIGDGSSTDLNGNGTPDDCETDCNVNDQPDDFDISSGFSDDCNTNDVPDECDIATGTSLDDNQNGTPDECEGPGCTTDTDGNGFTDVDDLVNVIIDWGTDGSANNTDVDGSGLVDVDDLVAIILAWGPC